MIFDEVLTGFKTGKTGAAGHYGVTPDVSIWSKALSCGFPVSVIGGRADIMEVMGTPLPQGVLQGGTHAGNIIGLAAAASHPRHPHRGTVLPRAARQGQRLLPTYQPIPQCRRPSHTRAGGGTGYGIYIGTTEPINSVADIRRDVDHELASDFFTACLDEGVYFHTDFTVTNAHTQPILDELVERATSAARRVVTGSAHTAAQAPGISA